MALADFLQALLKQPQGPQNMIADASSAQGSAGANGSAAYQNAIQAALAHRAPQPPAQGVSPITTGSVAPQPMNASGAAPAPVSQPSSGGNILDSIASGLQNILDPQARGRNETVDYLVKKGYSPGAATIIAGDKPMLRQALFGKNKGSDFAERAKAAQTYGLQPGTDDFRNFVLTGKIDTSNVRPMTAEERTQWGIPATDTRPYEMTQEGPKPIGGSGVTVNNNLPGQPAIGTIPQGFAAMQDPATGKWSMYRIPGGPADTSKTDEATANSQITKSAVITDAYEKARDLIGDSTTGLIGKGLGFIPPSDAAELRRQVGVLKANATIENLNAMRRQSPTGGALGNVTEGEGKMLAAAAGAIDPNSSPTQFKDQLDNYYHTLLRIVNGHEAGDRMFKEMKAEGNSQGNAPSAGTVEDGYRFKGGDPSKKENWEPVQ